MTREKLYSATEAAEQLSVTPARIRQLCQEGRIGQEVGSVWIITQAEIDDYRKNRRKAGRPKSVA